MHWRVCDDIHALRTEYRNGACGAAGYWSAAAVCKSGRLVNGKYVCEHRLGNERIFTFGEKLQGILRLRRQKLKN